MKNTEDLNESLKLIKFNAMSKEERLEYIKTYVIEYESYSYSYDEETENVIKSVIGAGNATDKQD